MVVGHFIPILQGYITAAGIREIKQLPKYQKSDPGEYG